MREIGVLSSLLVLLLVGAYASYNKTEEKVTDEKVTIVSAKPEELQSLTLVTKTQTVSASRKDLGDDSYYWFTIETKTRKRGFVASDKVEDLIKSFAPFEAIRSLGSKFSKEDLETAELESPRRRLELVYKSGPKVFDVGGRTHGARDHYVRPKGGGEVYLVASRVLGDLEFPEGRFMQRKLRSIDKKDVTAVTIEAAGKSARFVQQNRLSDKDAFWSTEAAPEEKSETAENYLHKVESLSVREYESEKHPLQGGDLVLVVRWQGENGDVVEEMSLFKMKGEDDKKPVYYASSTATKGVPGEVTRSVAEQLEQDLGVILQ